ncbi:MAG: pyruvate, phosphate dikinase, partial [Alphaproteobacteria bacterium]|nr:pyruvate, phosphate dikinase [Alphaproteobacteria bacterium]
MTKWVYSFGKTGTDGDASFRNLLGGKGANLAEMSSIGLPVPPGFTISTEVCTHFYDHDKTYPDTLDAEVRSAIAKIETETGTRFADPANPLLVSVRSGARASMPGMMDTVLNLGLNDATAEGLATRADDARFAYDSYRRFIQMYSDVVLEVDHGLFEDALEDMKLQRGVFEDTELSGDDLKTLVASYKDIVLDEAGIAFPQDPWEQLWGAVGAVFTSWMNARAVTYRRLNNIPAAWGTAVNVQAMVFGNMGEDCATGVAFTRDPSTGENSFYGEFLINAQGEDVVAGIRTPLPLTAAARQIAGGDAPSMQEAMPEVFAQLDAVRKTLEAHYRDMQDLEFTVQQNVLYMLQTRSGKRTAEAALRMAVEMADEGLITRDEALCRVDPNALDQLLHPTLDPAAEKTILARGLPASPGAACGKIVLNADRAEEMAAAGEDVILVRLETSPEDIHGMHAAVGILTARGGMTSHAAVVARGMGRACVSGASDVRFDEVSGKVFIADHVLVEGDIITIDGTSGEVYAGKVDTIQPKMSGAFASVMGWAADELAEVAAAAGVTIETARQRAVKLAETNPMLGHRGCRLAVTYPEICRMQATAIFEAACAVAQKTGHAPIPEIMVPLAATAKEIALCKAEIDTAATAVMAATGITILYLVGTMVELPRASICAADLAVEAEFFSFGTNDLTQTSLGISRDDASSFLHDYADKDIYPVDPFVSIDLEGVGTLVEMGVERGRITRPDIKLGICGEHGGDADSILFF